MSFVNLVVFAVFWLVRTGHGEEGMVNYCEGDTFRAECGPDEVVVMKAAKYGRMELGNCVKVDMGYIGCHADVLDLVDRRCSGRRKCEIPIPDTPLERTQPCLELKSYLAASYTCQKVLPVDRSLCRSSRYIRVTAPQGMIGSVTSQETWCGSGAAPWLIEALPGQNINISLIDFAYMSRSVTGGYAGGYSDSIEICQKYATIREEGPSRDAVVCGGRNKYQHAYLSTSNSVRVEVEPRREDPFYFILQFQVIGCPDPKLSQNAWFRRKHDQITIGCKGTSESWTLRCEGNKWLGTHGNCSQDDVAMASQMHSGIPGLPRGIIVAAVIAIALIVGVIVLLIGIVLVKRNKQRQLARELQEHPPVSPKSTEESEMDDDSDAYDEPIDDIYLRPDCGGQPPPHKLDPVPKGRTKQRLQQLESPYHRQSAQQHEYHIQMQPNRTGPASFDGQQQFTHIWEMPLPTPGEP